MPDKIKGINSATYFLKSYQINDQSFYEKIEEGYCKRKKDEMKLRYEVEKKKKEKMEKLRKEKENL